MKAWKTNDAQKNFTEILKYCLEEPQVVIKKNEPVAVIVSIQLFKELIGQQQRNNLPTIEQLLDEIQTVLEEDSFEIDIPSRA